SIRSRPRARRSSDCAIQPATAADRGATGTVVHPSRLRRRNRLVDDRTPAGTSPANEELNHVADARRRVWLSKVRRMLGRGTLPARSISSLLPLDVGLQHARILQQFPEHGSLIFWEIQFQISL